MIRAVYQQEPDPDPRIWMLRMKNFLASEEFTEEEVEACTQFVQEFLRQELPVYLEAAKAIQRYFHTTMQLANEETRREHNKLCQELVYLSDEITNVTYFNPDPDEDVISRN